MNKKIDFLNRNDDRTHTKLFFGSKTSNALKNNPISLLPKRRGRRPNKILENVNINDNNLSDDANQKNNSAVILRLKIDPSKLKNLKNMKGVTNKKNNSTDKRKIVTTDEKSEDSSSENMFINDIPDDNICHKCIKNEKALALIKLKLDKYEKKDKLNKTNKMYRNNLNFISYNSRKKNNH